MAVWFVVTGTMEFIFIALGNHSLSLGGVLPFEFPGVKMTERLFIYDSDCSRW